MVCYFFNFQWIFSNVVFIKFGCGKGSSFPKRKLPPKDETNTFIKIHHTQLGLQLQIFLLIMFILILICLKPKYIMCTKCTKDN